MKRVSLFAGTGVLVLIGAVVAAVTANASTVPQPTPVRAATIDTLSYFVNTHGEGLNGTHPFSQTVSGDDMYNVKWSSDAYEHYSYDDSYIYLREDHSAGPTSSYTFSDGVWMKRYMAVGDSVSASDNNEQAYSFDATSCTPGQQTYFPYVNTLVAHIPNDNLGGTLGTQDVIVVQYDYRQGVGTQYERHYYAKGWGLVKWELYNNGSVVQTSTFNQVVPNGGVTPPDLANACVGQPVTWHIPAYPTSLSGFVSDLYSCVLGIQNPDTPGFNYWLGHLQDHSLTIQGAYGYFFGYQPSSYSDEQFAKSVYDCVLFRDVDPQSLQNIENGLASGAFTRAQLVQGVLASAEFRGKILPGLVALGAVSS